MYDGDTPPEGIPNDLLYLEKMVKFCDGDKCLYERPETNLICPFILFCRKKTFSNSSARKLADLFNDAFDGIAQLNIHGRYMAINDKYADLFKYERGHPTVLANRSWIKTSIDENSREHVLKEILSIRDMNRQMKEIEAVGIKSDGSKFPIRISITGIFHQKAGCESESFDSSLLGVYIFVKDLTKYRQAIERAKELDAKFSKVFDQSPIGTAILDLDLNCTQINNAFCNMLGYEKEEIIGNNLGFVTFPDDLHIGEKLKSQLLNGPEECVHLEKRYVHKFGYPFWVSGSASIVRGENDQVTCFVVHVKDISDEKDIAEGIEEYQETIYEELNKQVFNAINTFISGIGHEVKSALQVLDDTVSMFLDHTSGELDLSDADQKLQLDRANQSVNKIDYVLNNIMNFGGLSKFKISSSQDFLQSIALDTHCVSVNNLIVETIDLFKCTMDYKANPVTIKCEIDGDIHAVVSDGLLRQILLNLVSNSHKTTASRHDKNLSDAFVEVRAYVKSVLEYDYVVIEVEDNGRGIPEHMQNKLFTPFFKAYRDVVGSGLGLFFCKTASTNANISLELKSSTLGKTIFVVEFEKRLDE